MIVHVNFLLKGFLTVQYSSVSEILAGVTFITVKREIKWLFKDDVLGLLSFM